MSKQRKGPDGEPLRSAAKTEGSGGTGAVEESLDDFRMNWSSIPDGEAPSSKDYYFDSYAKFGIHEDMLRDTVRTGCYMKAILNNANLFEGKTVLDVGSGTGILSLFAAQAGAKKCIGIECCEIAIFATRIAEENGYGDVITYVQGKVEEVELPLEEGEKVDIIISEWMGYFLIYESMLDSVLFARDKWLVKDGLIFPDHAKLYIAGIEDADYKEEKIGFWDQLWGFDFSSMRSSVLQEPISDIVDKTAIATTECCMLDLDLNKISREDLDFVVPYSLEATRKDFIHALVVWFDVSFMACTPPVVLDTAPGKASTHWKQMVLYFQDAVVVHEGETLHGLVALRKNLVNPRDIDVKMSFQLDGKYSVPPSVRYYRLR